MIRLIALCVLIYSAFILRSCMYNHELDIEKNKITHEPATVLEIGQCNSSECSVVIRDMNGTKQYVTTSDPVAPGQTLYRMCWEERVAGPQCYVKYTTSPRNK